MLIAFLLTMTSVKS